MGGALLLLRLAFVVPAISFGYVRRTLLTLALNAGAKPR